LPADDRQTVRILKNQWGDGPFDLAVVCGSGFGHLGDGWERIGALALEDLPCWPAPSIQGHPGKLLAARFKKWRCLVFQGRLHFYQQLSAWQVAAPVRIAADLGCRRLLLTNAAGGINERYGTGDLMFVRDHLNFLGDNPLRGVPDSFVDLSRLYRQDLFEPLAAKARHRGINLHRGVLAALPGPSFETPAEIDWLDRAGADAVSMSTIPEAIMAAHRGVEVVALSLIANPAAGRAEAPLSHQEVLSTAEAARSNLTALIEDLISLWQKMF